jgi:hypothetical protein
MGQAERETVGSEALRAVVRADARWAMTVGVVEGMCRHAGVELTDSERVALAGWYLDGCPVGGRRDPSVDHTLAHRGPVACLWAVVKVLGYTAPLTKRGQPSRSKAVQVRESFRAQAWEGLSDPERPGPLTAKQLMRACEWQPVPDPVRRAVRAAERVCEWPDGLWDIVTDDMIVGAL